MRNRLWLAYDLVLLVFGLSRLMLSEAWLRLRGKKLPSEEDAY